MDIEYLLIGVVFLITGIAIFVYKFRYHTIDDDEINSRINGSLFIGSLALIIGSLYLIWREIEKVI